MVKQLNLFSQGQIIPTALHAEMERSYLEYAMSVIVGRALPDVRDGLKPVHRRILYAMYELGLTPDRPFRKCARVVGDVLGKYHPHGDQAVYDAMVRLVQDFSSRYPLLAGHGNFGSVDNDPPAAMRYTETRLAAIAYESMLGDLNEATVDFTSNFDNSQQEPVVLPARVPILLLNGCSGIAVGMATNIPPHNLGEVVDGLIALIDRPELADEQLWQLIPGPDFPTGGQITDTTGIKEAYLTGKGVIPVRGVATVEQIRHNKKRSREKTAIVVTELPYQVNKAGWIEKVADLVNQGRLSDIVDIRDESDREGIRVAIELKRDADAASVLEQLYRHTALESNFGAIMLGLVNNKPCQLSLKELLQEFLKFRETTLTRQYRHELAESESRLHLLEGLLAALNNLDAVIDILRNAADGTSAKMSLQEELDISDAQANSILAMPLRRLTGLERQKLEGEYRDLQNRIANLKKLLGERGELLRALKKELRSLKRKFGDPRRTRIVPPSPPKSPAPEKDSTETQQQKTPPASQKNSSKESDKKIPENALVRITHRGFIYWQDGGKIDPTLPPKKNDDLVIYQQLISGEKELLVIFDSGRAYPLEIAQIKGYPHKQVLGRLLSDSATRDNCQPIFYFCFNKKTQGSHLLLLTKKGKLKRISCSELEAIGNRGLMLIKLREGDSLAHVNLTREGEEVAIATNGGRILRYLVSDTQIPLMGRAAQGNQGIKLRYGEAIVGCANVTKGDRLFLVSELGYGKIIPVDSLRTIKVGELGTQAFIFDRKEDNLAQMVLARRQANFVLLTNRERRLAMDIDALKLGKKGDQGRLLAKVPKNEKILSVISYH